MKTTEKMVEAAAKAMERHYHRENGVCDERDGGPNDCWKSMIEFARPMLRAALRSSQKEKGVDQVRLDWLGKRACRVGINHAVGYSYTDYRVAIAKTDRKRHLPIRQAIDAAIKAEGRFR